MLKIMALMDDMPGENPQLQAEHGLSFFAQYGEHRILFDCGQSGAALENARRLGLPLEKTEAVVISHSHYDHGRGYRAFAEGGCRGPLYTGRNFFEEKFARAGESLRDLSPGFDLGYLWEKGITHRTVSDITELFPGVYLIGNFPRKHSFEKIPERFLRKTREGLIHDDFSDEICVAIQISGGLAVLVGCSHPGILNMVTHVRNILKQPVLAVFGGSHLVEADEGRIQSTLKALEEMGVARLGFSHCSGEAVLQGRIALGETVVFE